jgi:hypothetical protein
MHYEENCVGLLLPSGKKGLSDYHQ